MSHKYFGILCTGLKIKCFLHENLKYVTLIRALVYVINHIEHLPLWDLHLRFLLQPSCRKHDLSLQQLIPRDLSLSVRRTTDIDSACCKAEAAVFYNAVCILCSPLNPFLRTDFNL